MRASLAANTVHVPGTWGGWRIHATQATSSVSYHSEAHAARIDEMADHAIKHTSWLMSLLLAGRLRNDWAPLRSECAIWCGSGQLNRLADVGRIISEKGGSTPARRNVLRLTGRPVWPESVPGQVHGWLSSLGIPEPLSPYREVAPQNVPGSKALQPDFGHNGGRRA
jgi:hypothetical protein